MEKPRKILVVDDSRSFIEYLSVLLRRMGYRKVITADNGLEALKMLRLWTPDTIIMDAWMPGVDGMDALGRIKQDPMTRDIPVIMISTSHDPELARRAARMGAAGFLGKPFEVDALHQLLQECVARRGINKRRHVRAGYQGLVRIVPEDGGASEAHYAVSLSEGGIYIRRDPPLAIDSRVRLWLDIADGPDLEITGRVIYTMCDGGSLLRTPTGMALAFDPMEGEALGRLRRFVFGLLMGAARKSA